RGLVTETVTDSRAKADTALNRFWRNDEDGRAVLLRISPAGAYAIGVEPATGPDVAHDAPSASDAPAPAGTAASATTGADTAHVARRPREGTKTTVLLALLRRPAGATMAEMTAATGWLPHTARAFLATTVRKKLGLELVTAKPKGQDRC